MLAKKVFSPFRERCLQCRKTYVGGDLFAGLCASCFQRRSKGMRAPEYHAGTRDIYKCAECKVTLDQGFMEWDRTSNTFLLLCIPCSNKKHHTDDIYKGTQFAYRVKAQ